ncbi:L-asparaginase, putative [Talaromyces marneffei ATCC 18224]|uniref:L-asparaginase, putative n=1 Tax=Talaromyces marneffei (strain ATCC 18224 / CBS 334.59 / QM 7333) TaxID=441960 RepID=B6QAD8_TALMQ|nr:L-asparaginase, putative [Talaromyces marneffei ATCC 18224]
MTLIIRSKTVTTTTGQWHFVLHGGCSETCADADRQRETVENLRSVAESVSNALSQGATAKEVVVLAVAALEDCPTFNAGHGAALNEEGVHQLEAGIVDGATKAYGAVGLLETTKNPIRLANELLENGPHTIIVGRAADDLAKELGLETVPNSYFTTPFRITLSERSKGKKIVSGGSGTVGAVVLDSHGQLAAGGSTGGGTGKKDGRLGDTALLGAGLYADDRISVVCSGAGDEILKHSVAAAVAQYHSNGYNLRDAARQALAPVSQAGASCSVVALDANGESVVESNARHFPVSWGSSSTSPESLIHPTTIPVLQTHIFYQDNQLIIGHSRYPSTRGHTLAAFKTDVESLFDLSLDEFVRAMKAIRTVTSAVRKFYQVGRCALITEGKNVLSIWPLHGLGRDWKPITSDVKEYQKSFPGYISSYDGPMMASEQLDEICSKIRSVSGLSDPLNYRFDGPDDDNNLFARIIRGELSQWRVWEDDEHVAFLTPFPNTDGFTVLAPRAHLSSDVLSLEEQSYTKLMAAAHTVAGILMTAFGAERCGMIFEGFEINYAHIKLIPIHAPVDPPFDTVAPFHETYQGYVSSLQGPICPDCPGLVRTSQTLRQKIVAPESASPPRSWSDPSRHLLTVLQDPWYEVLFTVQDTLFHTSTDFFRKSHGYQYCLVPSTTDAVSSPMGLGSDSLPVSVSLLGQSTYLADSMQFALEYFLRIRDTVPGVYYISTSFRGEDHDARHVNQFHHVECELRGSFAQGIKIAEGYILNLVATLLRDHAALIQASTADGSGRLDHLTSLHDYAKSHGGRFPQIALDDALSLPTMQNTKAEIIWRPVSDSDSSKGRTLTPLGERRLLEHFGGGPVWVTEMDHLSVPFYQAYTDSARRKARCADLLLGSGEVLGLGERHVSADEVRHALNLHQVADKGKYKWYTDVRESKPLQTVGWGMGIERFLAWVFRHDDIRDLLIVPRLKGMSFAP